MPTMTPMLVAAVPRRSGVLALPVVAAVVLAVTIAADATTDRTSGFLIAPEPTWYFGIAGLVCACSATAMLRSPAGARRLGAAMAALAVGWMVGAVLHVAVRAGADSAPLLWVTEAFSNPLVMLTVVLAAYFPTGRLLPGGWGRLTAGAVVGLVGIVVVLALLRTPLTMSTDHTDIAGDVPAADSTGVPWLTDLLQPHVLGLANLTFVPTVVIAASLVQRYRRTSGVERDQMRWLFWCVLSVVLITLAWRLLIEPGQLSSVGVLVACCTISVSIAVAVVNPTLVSIEDLLSRTLVYGGLSIVIIVVDLAALSVLTTLLDERLDEQHVVLFVLLLSALLYNPLRAWLWTFVRRLVLGERDDPYDVVAGLASSLESVDEGREQLEAVATAVATAFGVGHVSVEVERPDGSVLVAGHGPRPAQTRTLPITYRDAEVGRLVLPQKGIRGRLSSRDQRLLGDLVRQAATAARTGLLAEELQENRQHLVVAREEERRRIRNELHEDLGPTLGGLVNQVEAARLLVAERPALAKEKIEATSVHLRAVVADVRRVVHDLRPPALDDRGLVGALRQQADLASSDTLTVTVTGDRLEGLPAAVEVAAFRIVSAVVSQVGDATEATTCAVELDRRDRELLVEVDTDVVLLTEPLAQRAAELGGRTEVGVRTGGGTLLRSRLPVREGEQ